MTSGRFDAQALYDAVDAQRRERGLTWTALSKELKVSASTIREMPRRTWGIELDGVLLMTRWLGRTVETFAGGEGGSPPRPASYRETRTLLRFDTRALHAALNAEREKRGKSWPDLAADIWPSGPWGADQLKNLSKGGRAEVHAALAICGWLGTTIQTFTRETVT